MELSFDYIIILTDLPISNFSRFEKLSYSFFLLISTAKAPYFVVN